MSARIPIRVVLTGSESTGKSRLAERLAERWGAVRVDEFARAYARDHRGELEYADVEPIARGQIANEDTGIAAGGPLVILDTDLVSTVVYAHHYYGSCPAWIECAAHERLGDLYLLHHPDVAWIPDPGIRDRPDRRAAVHDEFERRLAEFGARVVDVVGDWDQRERAAVAAIDRLLAQRSTT